MVLIPNNQDLSAASGLIPVDYFEAIYHSFMSDAMVSLGRTVIIHLQPIREQDVPTQSSPAAQQYNPFFQRVPVPNNTTRNAGVKITPRDVQYKAQIRVGPINDDSMSGMGRLNVDEAMITVVVEALEHVNDALSFSIEGRRYTRVGDPRPIGFSQRKYLMVKLREIQEAEPGSSDKTVG